MVENGGRSDLGLIHLETNVQHVIDAGYAKPMTQAPYGQSHFENEFLKEHVQNCYGKIASGLQTTLGESNSPSQESKW